MCQGFLEHIQPHAAPPPNSLQYLNIDSFEYAKDNQGNKYRSALCSISDCVTFPQCFIGGEFMGGAADACIKHKKGKIH